MISPLHRHLKQPWNRHFYSLQNTLRSPIISYSILCCHMPSYSIIVNLSTLFDLFDRHRCRSSSFYWKFSHEKLLFLGRRNPKFTDVPHCPSKAWWSISLSTCDALRPMGAVGFDGTKSQRFYHYKPKVFSAVENTMYGHCKCPTVAYDTEMENAIKLFTV